MLTVKAYLRLENSSIEVRRFVICTNNCGFKDFQQKVQVIFPVLASKKFNITWIDEEQDVITMSSDEELAQAVAHINNIECLKVDLVLLENQSEPLPKEKTDTNQKPTEIKNTEKTSATNQKQSTENKNTEDGNHPNIICDGCERKVHGSRFKCLECDDYDLCSICFAKDIHPDHDMLRIVSSNKMLQTAHWFMPMRHIWHKLGRKAAHYHEKQAHHQMKAECKQAKHEHKGFGKHRHHGIHHHERYCSRTDDERNAVDGNQLHTCNNDAHNAAREQSHEMLRCIGETVANLLDPLGINVSIDVENSDGEVEPAVRKRNSKSEECSGKNGPEESIKKDSKEQSTDASTKPKEKGVKFAPTLSEIEKSQKEKKYLDSLRNLDVPDNGWTMINSTVTTEEEKKTSIPEASAAVVEKIAATPLIPAEKILPSAATAVQETSNTEVSAEHALRPFLTTSLYPDLENMSPKVNDALSHMISMGYSNEGGWLSALLKAKNADIAAVLDILHPHCPQA